jgi:hypothetical protein
MSFAERSDFVSALSRIEYEDSRRRHPAMAARHREEQIAARGRFRALHAPPPEWSDNA